MADNNYNPSERFDMGPGAAGCGRTTVSVVSFLNGTVPNTAVSPGLTNDGALRCGVVRVGLNAAGAPRNIEGPNRAGAPRSVNGT